MTVKRTKRGQKVDRIQRPAWLVVDDEDELVITSLRDFNAHMRGGV